MTMNNNKQQPAIFDVPSQLPSKRDLPRYVETMIADMIESGVVDMAEIYARLKFINETTSAAMKNKDMISAVIDEIDLNNDNEKVLFNKMRLSKSSTGTKYDYSFDDRWKGLQEDLQTMTREVDRIKQLIKDREEFLTAVAKSDHDTFDEHGVLIEKPKVKTPSRHILVARF